jgi:hypothetical protein
MGLMLVIGGPILGSTTGLRECVLRGRGLRVVVLGDGLVVRWGIGILDGGFVLSRFDSRVLLRR